MPRRGEYAYDDREVVQRLADGETLDKIARDLGKSSTSGVRLFLDRTRRSLGLKTRDQMVAHYVRNEWID